MHSSTNEGVTEAFRALTIPGLFCFCSLIASPRGDPFVAKNYNLFRSAFAKNDVAGLQSLASDLESARGTFDVHLGLLALAAASLRSDDYLNCIRITDSLARELESDDELFFGWVHKFKAMVLSRSGDPEEALTEVDMSLHFHRRPLYPLEWVDQSVTKAEILRALQRSDEAIDELRAAQHVSDSLGYTRGTCLVAINLGNLKYEQKRYREAWEDYRRTLELATDSGYDMVAQNALNNLGSTAIMLENYDLALHLYDSLLTILGNRSPELRARLHNQKGFAYREMGDQANALASFLKAITLKDSIGDTIGQLKVQQHMAGSLWALERRQDALTLLTVVLEGSERHHLPQLSLEVHSKLAKWYKEIGDVNSAFAHKAAESSLSDSLVKARFSAKAATSEVLFETERKEHTIKEQEQALLLAEAEDRKKSFQRNVSIGVAALLLLIATLLYRSMRTRKRLAEKEKELHGEQVDQLLSQQEIKSINAMLEGQEKERDRVAKDLHDRLGSMLGGIKAQLGALEDRVEQVQHDAQFQKVNRLLDETVGELRRISHDMAASTLSRFGLEKALKDLRDTIHISGRLSVELSVFGSEQRLERSVEIAVYRIIQELVSNVLKHAKAGELSIAVTRTPGRLSVMVTDNGVGFDTGAPKEGMGLENVRSRAAALGGMLQVDSTPGKGSSVSVECPIVE